MAKEPLKYWKAEDVEEIASELINQFHPHLAGESIIYLFRSQHAEANGRVEFGKARKVSGLNAYLAVRGELEEANGEGDNPDGKEESPPIKLIEIAFDVWKAFNATQRIALVDHELCHFSSDGGMRGHDVEEFRAVIDRHGLWRPEIEAFAQTIAQQNLFPTTNQAVKPAATTASDIQRLANNPKIRKAIDKLRPKKGSGIESVTITVEGHEPVTLTARN